MAKVKVPQAFAFREPYDTTKSQRIVQELEMGLLEGKRGVIMGVANERSLAAAVAKYAHAEGAELGFSYVPRMEAKVKKIAEAVGAKLIAPCDVADNQEIEAFFKDVQKTMGRIDFLVHSIAFAPTEDLKGATLQVSREGFKQAMDISVYSFIAAAKAASDLMQEGGSLCAMTYYGGEKVIGGYNLMGVCKAALDAAVKYTAYDLGPNNIRVNAISAGPVRTLASSAVGDFKAMLQLNAAMAPLGRNIEADEVGKAAVYLLSDLSSAVSGEIHHVDCGYHIMGSPGHAIDRLQKGASPG